LKNKNKSLKWVADFRDPWSDMDYLSEFRMSPKSILKMERLEQSVVSSADKLIVTSKGATSKLLKGCGSDNSVFIPNGWDEADFPKSRARKKEGSKIRIGHFGSLHGSRDVDGLWKAISENNDPIELVFAGSIDSSITSKLETHGILDSCEFLGNLPHKESIIEMLKCDILLLIHNDTESAKNSTPGKLFEYLATSIPIISFCHKDGDLARVLNSMNLPHSSHKDVEGAKEMLRTHNLQKPANAAPFTRKNLTAELIEVLKSIQ
jgi:glycosyltransferase involved in cell wall biosynthesis